MTTLKQDMGFLYKPCGTFFGSHLQPKTPWQGTISWYICVPPRQNTFRILIVLSHLRHNPVAKSVHDLTERRTEWIIKCNTSERTMARPKPNHMLPARPWSNLESMFTAIPTISGDEAYCIRIADQSKCESCVVTSTCRVFILNKVTLLYDSLMILEGHWRAFISLAAREISLVSTECGTLVCACGLRGVRPVRPVRPVRCLFMPIELVGKL
jgi:hypothetical protein